MNFLISDTFTDSLGKTKHDQRRRRKDDQGQRDRPRTPAKGPRTANRPSRHDTDVKNAVKGG